MKFSPDTVKSEFNHVFCVISKVSGKGEATKYKYVLKKSNFVEFLLLTKEELACHNHVILVASISNLCSSSVPRSL